MLLGVVVGKLVGMLVGISLGVDVGDVGLLVGIAVGDIDAILIVSLLFNITISIRLQSLHDIDAISLQILLLRQ